MYIDHTQFDFTIKVKQVKDKIIYDIIGQEKTNTDLEIDGWLTLRRKQFKVMFGETAIEVYGNITVSITDSGAIIPVVSVIDDDGLLKSLREIIALGGEHG